MHIHVAVDDPDKAIQVVNGLLPHLGPLLALSASSPFWRGEPTGLASSRQIVFSAFPRSGPPPRFRDYDDYAAVVGQLERTGCIADYTHIWWDIRPHPKWGTIEVRICDAVTRVEDAVAIAAYCQALVKALSDHYDTGEEIPSYHRILTSENKWLAARYGLDAPVMDLATGRRIRIPIAKLVRRTLRELEPHARELGSERELEGIEALLGRGNSAERQLRIFNANRDIVEVARAIADATEGRGASERRARPPFRCLRARPDRRACTSTANARMSIAASSPPRRLQDERPPRSAEAARRRAVLVPAPRQLDAERLPAHRVERVDEREPGRASGRACTPRRAPGPNACVTGIPVMARPPRRGVDDRLAHETPAQEVVGTDAVRRAAGRRVLGREELRAVGRDGVERPAAAERDRPLHAARASGARTTKRVRDRREGGEDERRAVEGEAAERAVEGDDAGCRRRPSPSRCEGDLAVAVDRRMTVVTAARWRAT